MLHKLLKERRLGHLKVGARTLITAEHLEAFREATMVGTTRVAPDGDVVEVPHSPSVVAGRW